MRGEPYARETDEIAAVHWLAPAAIRRREDAPPYLLRDVERIEAVRAGTGGAPADADVDVDDA